MRKGQILLTTLIILMIISLIVIFITSSVMKSGRMTALNYEYDATYNSAETDLIYLIDQLRSIDFDLENLTIELAKNNWECEQSDNKEFICKNTNFEDNDIETIVRIKKDNNVLNYDLAKEDYFDLILNDGTTGNFKGQVNLAWLGDSALELKLIYQAPNGELKNQIEVIDSSINSVYHSAGDSKPKIFNNKLSSFENKLNLDFSQINYKAIPVGSVFKYLRIKAVNKSEGTVINIRPELNGSRLPDQVISLSAIGYLKNRVESASPVVFSQIPLSPQLPSLLNIGLNTKLLIKPFCGNNVVEGEEPCDDGNKDEKDGCTSLCEGPAAICDNETLANGSFDDITMTFKTHYERGDLFLEGHYEITDNPKKFHGAFGACKDNTTGTGNMLVINGNYQKSQKIICQTIKGLKKDSNYKFSIWLTSVFPESPAHIWMSINNEFVKEIKIPSDVCKWKQYVGYWNSKSYRNAEVCIIDQNTARQGNDFAIDDISFMRHCDPVPTICDINWDSKGGDAGYKETFKLDNASAGTELKVLFEPFSKKDRFIVSSNKGIKYDSGCVGDSLGTDFNYSGDITIEDDDEELTLEVVPNCTGGSGTAWKLKVECL